MLTIYPPRKSTPNVWSRSAHLKSATPNADWRCTKCGMLLGVHRDGRMHLRHGRNHEYFVSLPAQAICRDCGTLNQARPLSPG